MNLEAGDIALYHGSWKDWQDVIIMLGTRSPYVHAAFGLGNNTLVEAWWDGVRIKDVDRSFTLFRPTYQSEEAKAAAVAKARTFVTYKYDFPSLPFVTLYDIPVLKKIVTKLLQRVDNGNAIFCSELVCRAIFEGGIDMGIPPYVCSPADLADYFKDNIVTEETSLQDVKRFISIVE